MANGSSGPDNRVRGDLDTCLRRRGVSTPSGQLHDQPSGRHPAAWSAARRSLRAGYCRDPELPDYERRRNLEFCDARVVVGIGSPTRQFVANNYVRWNSTELTLGTFER